MAVMPEPSHADLRSWRRRVDAFEVMITRGDEEVREELVIS